VVEGNPVLLLDELVQFDAELIRRLNAAAGGGDKIVEDVSDRSLRGGDNRFYQPARPRRIRRDGFNSLRVETVFRNNVARERLSHTVLQTERVVKLEHFTRSVH